MLTKIIEIAVACTATFAIVVNAQGFGPRLEGYLLPVANNMTITQTNEIETIETETFGTIGKLRDCQYDHLEWMYGKNSNRSVRVLVKFVEGSKIRPEGGFSFGPWIVQLTPKQITENSFVKVFHKCHPFWITETHLYF